MTLAIERRLWNRFKVTIPRDTRLNDAVVELIERHVADCQTVGVAPERPFITEHDDKFLVLYANGSKCREFDTKEESADFLETVSGAGKEDLQ